ncbi:MAG: hypothetical protein VX910_06050 [Candidatus Latescibacterota bacterium]|nr:hypothetical protein [Candidatus Latescibacterota bacterium]
MDAAPLKPPWVGVGQAFTEMATVAHPDRATRHINKGIGGNRITHLKERWNDDVFANAPDRLSIKIGINDLHSVLRNVEDPVTPSLFEETYEDLLTTTQERLSCPGTWLS